jgi:hypothetical protein
MSIVITIDMVFWKKKKKTNNLLISCGEIAVFWQKGSIFGTFDPWWTRVLRNAE